MSESHRATDPSLQAGNMQSSPEKVNVAGYVYRLLADNNLDGREIIDRFIGAVVANGEVHGSVAKYAPEDVLNIISSVAAARNEVSDNTEDPGARAEADEMSLLITNMHGYRRAFYELGDDKRTKGLMHHTGSYGSLSGRAGLDGNTSGFASLDALHSYLLVVSENYAARPDHDVATAAEAVSIDGVVSAISSYARLSNGELGFRDTLGKLVASDVDDVRKGALELQRQLNTLELRGVDLYLIGETAERLRKYRNVRALGDMAGGQVRVQGFNRQVETAHI